jgi:hypothetical protein
MRMLIIMLCFGLTARAQFTTDSVPPLPTLTPSLNLVQVKSLKEKIKVSPVKWKMTGNRWLTGGLIVLAGASKGFNETLMFHWKEFRRQHPNANAQWLNPAISWRNKYQDGDPEAGAKFPLSTSVLVLFTDQYHLNTFINRAAWTSTIVIKIGEGKKTFKHYVYDFLYYTVCHQIGFAAMYYPYSKYKGK